MRWKVGVLEEHTERSKVLKANSPGNGSKAGCIWKIVSSYNEMTLMSILAVS